VQRDPIADLLNLHHVLEVEHDDGDKGNFLFGWQCQNPFADDLLAATRERSLDLNHTQYSYLEEDFALVEKIRRAHQKLDGVTPKDVFCGAGATALLVTFAAYLRTKQIREVYFLSPIYFSAHFAFRLFGIRVRQISRRHAFEADFKMNLPKKEAVLILTDPIWYAGLPIPKIVIDQIARWQEEIGGIVFIDGSFQYMPWDKAVIERTAHLNPARTIRLVSPSKSLCVAGYRFAYLFMPFSWRQDFSHIYTNIYASASADTIAFGHEAVGAMLTRDITGRLTDLIVSRHSELRSAGKIESTIQASCGYFVFEKLKFDLPPNYVRMGGEYFDQVRYPGYTRINLLSPAFSLFQQF
jgi:histidinol-phosphate/aromatic aminotransferase/cobyric acid decarboxylase-like protein